MDRFVWAAFCLFLAAFLACPSVRSEEHRLGPGDVLRIEVWGEKDISGEFTLSPAGTLQKSWLPEVKVQGLTLEEAKTAFVGALKKFMKTPKVKMEIIELRSRRVSLVGGFGKPGQYTLTSKRNLLPIILQAGGVQPEAEQTAVIIRAPEKGDKITRITVDVRKLLKGSDLKEDKQLEAGDVVYLPLMAKPELAGAATAKSIFVTGAVKKMGTFPYREGYTALNAVIDAGGFTKFAAPGRAKVVRGKGKDEKIIKVDLNAVVNRGDKTKNVNLMPGDILVVPESYL